MYRTLSRLFLPPALWLVTRGAAPFSAKIRRGVRERQGLRARMLEASDALRGCVWVHSASAGEYEQARPILRALAARLPTYHSSFSPSGLDQARRHPEATLHDLLDWDTPANARFALDTLQPRALVFTKFDCWPNLVYAAHDAGVPLLLLDASFPPTSRRANAIARSFYRALFDCFQQIGAIGEDDVRRYKELGVRAPITVTGDTKSEAVLARFEQSASGELHSLLGNQPFRYVTLGSIWPQDEAVVLPPLLDRMRQDDTIGVIAVPHEPTADAIARLGQRFARAGIESRTLSALLNDPPTESAPWRALLVDSVGKLAEIYRASSLAYVGGGFGDGVHNVLEPAICEQPVLFGPRHRNAAEAAALLAARGARVLQSIDEAREALRWLDADSSEREAAGRRAREFVLSQRGATARSLQLLEPYLER